MDIIKPEVDLGLNNFQQQKLFSINESIAQLIINLLLLRPGNIPGLPHLGINIREYLYKRDNDIDTDQLKAKILGQCSELLPGLITGSIDVVFIPNYNNQQMLIISVKLYDNNTVNIGMGTTLSGDVTYKYEFENQIKALQSQIGNV